MIRRVFQKSLEIGLGRVVTSVVISWLWFSCRFEYSSEEEAAEADFDIEIDVNNIMPYMYEPLASDSAVEVEEDAEEDVNDEDTHRIGNTDW